MCQHQICKDLHISKFNNEVAVVIFNWYNGTIPVVLLGKDKDDQGEYTVCFTKINQQDNGCYLSAIIRILTEKFKINLNSKQFDYHFKNKFNQFNIIDYHNTPVFIGKFLHNSRHPINDQIHLDLNNRQLDNAYKRVIYVEWFNLDGIQIENRNIQINFRAKSILEKIDINLL